MGEIQSMVADDPSLQRPAQRYANFVVPYVVVAGKESVAAKLELTTGKGCHDKNV